MWARMLSVLIVTGLFGLGLTTRPLPIDRIAARAIIAQPLPSSDPEPLVTLAAPPAEIPAGVESSPAVPSHSHSGQPLPAQPSHVVPPQVDPRIQLQIPPI